MLVRSGFCGRVRPRAGARDSKHGRTRPYGPALLLFATLLATGCQIRTDPYGRTVLSTPTLGRALGLGSQDVDQPQTPAGLRRARLLSITPAAATGAVQDQRVVGGHTVQIVAAQDGHQVVVDGRVVVIDVQDDRVLIQGVHQDGGRTYVLIAEQSGGNACPSLYQAVDLSGRAPVVSPRFGNCSDVPSVNVVGGALRMSVPAFRAEPAATYAFRDGHLSH